MMTNAIEKLITNSIRTAFIKYSEGDGGTHLDYEWIPPEHSALVTKAVLMDLEAGGSDCEAASRARGRSGEACCNQVEMSLALQS
jgi:hypothetical protein